MSKETKQPEVKDGKIVTKYDKKVARRKEEERREARTRRIAKITGIVIAVVAAVVIVVTSALSLNRIYREYIRIDGESVNQIEFDLYYSLTKNGILSQTLYGDVTYLDYFQSYLGYNSSKSDRSQMYNADKEYTWFDYFAGSTVSTIKEYKALLSLAEKNNFEYTKADEDYKEFTDEMKKAADEAGMSLSGYYKATIGKHATANNVEEFVREYLKAVAYEEAYYEANKASDDEVKKYYDEHKDDYDCVEYRSVYIRAEEKDNAESLAEAKKKAEELIKDASSTETLAKMAPDYVAKSDVETYKKDDATLMKEIYKSSLSDEEAKWLFNSGRKADDKTIFSDEENDQYHIVWFVKREYNKDNDETIRSVLYSKFYEKTMKPLVEAIEVEDTFNRIKMLEN